MFSNISLGSLSNLIGWDGLIIFGVQALLVVGGIILLVRFIRGQNSANQTTSSPSQRLQELDSMRRKGAVTTAEYEEHRKRILSEM